NKRKLSADLIALAAKSEAERYSGARWIILILEQMIMAERR
ncbi:unnamed protein product, partial [Tetraodon nigroviridis]